MTEVVLRVEIELEGSEVCPMQLDNALSSELKWIKDSIMSHQYQHDGIIHVDWDDPRPAKLSIHIEEIKDG